MIQQHSTLENIVDRMFGWWYAIAAPPAVPEEAPLQQRTFIRKSRLISIILLIEIVYHLLYLYIVVVPDRQPAATLPISVTIGCFVIGIILNRLGKQRTASIIAFVAIELSMCFYFISQSFTAGGFSLTHLSILSILVSPDIIAVSLFPAWVALSLGTFNCVFVVVILAFFPKAPDMIQQFATFGPIDYFQAVSVQAVVLLVSLFWANNASREMQRADRAEEVNKLTQALMTHQRAALESKKQLEESIQQIMDVHTQVANGNFEIRVPLDHSNVLWGIAGSLNNLLARLQRWRQDAQRQQYTEQAIQQVLHDIQEAKMQGTPLLIRKTGTTLDPLIAEITGDRSFYHTSLHGSPTPTSFSQSLDQFPFPGQNL